MELEQARLLLDAERAQVQQLLADLGTARTEDHDAERDASYPAQPLAQQGVDDAVAAGLRDRLTRSIGLSSGSKTAATAARSAAAYPSRMNALRQTRRPSSLSRKPATIKRRIDSAPLTPIKEARMPKAAHAQVPRA
jgi:hypothetical protein